MRGIRRNCVASSGKTSGATRKSSSGKMSPRSPYPQPTEASATADARQEEIMVTKHDVFCFIIALLIMFGLISGAHGQTLGNPRPTVAASKQRVDDAAKRLMQLTAASKKLTVAMTAISKEIDEAPFVDTTTNAVEETKERNREVNKDLFSTLGSLRSAVFGLLSLRADVCEAFEKLSDAVEINGTSVTVQRVQLIGDKGFLTAYTDAATSVTTMNFTAAKLAKKFKELAEKFGIQDGTISTVARAAIRP